MKPPRVLRPLLSFVLIASVAAAATPEEKLQELGLKLPPTGNPVANYVPAVRTGNLVFLAGHISRGEDGKVITGKVGREVTDKDANAAARLTALAMIATLKKEIGALSKVKRIVKVSGFVNATDSFTGQSQVINGCSDLLVAVFGERGKHARAALGMGSLPLGAVVEIEMIVEVE